LINLQPFLFFYELLLPRVGELTAKLEQSCSEFDTVVENLRNLMELSDSVPTSKAAPLFLALATVWRSFQTCEDAVRLFELLLARLRKHRDAFSPSLAAGPDGESHKARPDSDAEQPPRESEVIADDA
jgi:hypothetical protein